MTTSSEKSNFFDLHITGLGYLNRIREVKPKKGDAFLACDIAALNGPSDKPEYRRFDVRVSGSEAQHLIRRCVPAVEAERKVLIGFRLGDLWTDIFTYSKGKRVGEQGISLKARLLFVSWTSTAKASTRAISSSPRFVLRRTTPAAAWSSRSARTWAE